MKQSARICAFALASALFWSNARPARGDEPPPAAAAEDPAAKAASLKSSGDDAMQRLDYGAALTFYDQAYALQKDPALLYNRGRALQALGRFPEALDALEAFQRDAPEALKARVPMLSELVGEVRGKVGTLALSANVTGARVVWGRRVIGTTPFAEPLRLNAGTAMLEVSAEGYHPYKKKLELPGGGRTEVSIQLHSKRTTGVLEISSPVAGAVVWIDGRRIGTVPAQAAVGGGSHTVVVRRDGYEEASTNAEVRVGESSRMDVPLRSPPAITSRWWFWTGVGAVVLGGTALTIALLTERDAEPGTIPPGKVSGPLLHF